jgi:hypothetical protein
MIEIDEPSDARFHARRAAEEDARSLTAHSPIESALHREFAALHRIALQRIHSRNLPD